MKIGGTSELKISKLILYFSLLQYLYASREDRLRFGIKKE